jgi:hypothetical protein
VTDYRKITQAELVAEASARFGDDPLNWAFVCPSCGDVADGNDFRQALAEHPRERKDGEAVIASDLVGQECIGRTLGALKKGKYTGRGCNWVSFGLFSGPWQIVMPNGRTAPAFSLATAPPIERTAAR